MISLSSCTNLVIYSNLPVAIQSNSFLFFPEQDFKMCDSLSKVGAEQVKRFVLDRGGGLQLTGTEESWFTLSLLLFVLFFSSGNLCLSSEIRDFSEGTVVFITIVRVILCLCWLMIIILLLETYV